MDFLAIKLLSYVILHVLASEHLSFQASEWPRRVMRNTNNVSQFSERKMYQNSCCIVYVFLVAPCICFAPFVWKLHPWQTTFSSGEKYLFQLSAGLEASRVCFEFFFQDVLHVVPQPDFRPILLLFPERSTSCFWETLPDTPNFSSPHNLTPTWPNLAHSRKKSSRRHRP